MLMLLLALFVSVYLELKHYLCILKLSMAISVWICLCLCLRLRLCLCLSLSDSVSASVSAPLPPPPPQSLTLSLSQVIFVLFGGALIGISVYVLNDAILVKFVSRSLVIAGLFGGIVFSLLALLGLWGATRTHTHGTGKVHTHTHTHTHTHIHTHTDTHTHTHTHTHSLTHSLTHTHTHTHTQVMTIYWLVNCLALVAEVIVIFSLVVWIDDVSQASTDASQQSDSSVVARTSDSDSDSAAEGNRDGGLIDDVVTEIEGFACRTYKSCCWTHDASAINAANRTTCTQAHAGSSVGSAAAAQHDPSAPSFCSQVTGSTAQDDISPAILCKTLSESTVDGAAGGSH
eukprot:COSAG03_NODE_2413_length_2796_cov_18.928810_2_plen_344_part_00